jgi:Cdc6-like AAA superfamily ATPase
MTTDVKTNILIPKSLHKKLRIWCIENDLTMTEFFKECINNVVGENRQFSEYEKNTFRPAKVAELKPLVSEPKVTATDSWEESYQ